MSHHHHELEWRATCESRQPVKTIAPSTCKRPAKRSLWARILSLFGV